ncbi:hypothetical protein N7485_002994 [Penicillium canescens]|nr:hypothetical protein N7485_002994 [Penicillium canescens]
MQSFFQHRDIRRQLQKQFVTKHEKPGDVWTLEGRYSYQDGEIRTIPREPDDDLPAERRKEHGHRTIINGPTLYPRHTIPSVRPTDVMVTGIERARPGAGASTDVSGGGSVGESSQEFEGSDIEWIKKNKLIMVTYDGECDPMDPHNWTFKRRLACTLITPGTACVIFWSSTIDTTAIVSTRALYRTNTQLQVLATTMSLVMNGLGALVTAPISEVFGRNPTYIPSMILFMLFNMGAGLAQTVVQRIVCRALAGLFGSAPAVLAAASLVDIWSRIERVYMFPLFSIITFTGPLVGPTPWGICCPIQVGKLALGGLDYHYLWRNNLGAACAVPTRNIQLQRASFIHRLRNSLYRPILLFVTEPIISVHAFYLAVEVITLYTFISGYASIYGNIYHWSTGLTAVASLGIELGVLLSAPAVPIAMYFLRREIIRSRTRGQHRPDPEISLYMGMFGAPAIPISMFWMGWTARESISYWSLLASSVMLGFGVLCIFVSSYQYVAGSFELHAASALSSLQVLRLVASGVMAIVSEIMYRNLGVAWTLTVLGGISFVFFPVPYVSYWKGPQVQARSRYARRNEA